MKQAQQKKSLEQKLDLAQRKLQQLLDINVKSLNSQATFADASFANRNNGNRSFLMSQVASEARSLAITSNPGAGGAENLEQTQARG